MRFCCCRSVGLLSNLPVEAAEKAIDDDPLLRSQVYVALESALLYMIGGYDINAVSMVRNIAAVPVGPPETIRDLRLINAMNVVDRTVAFCRGEVRRPEARLPVDAPKPETPGDYDLLLEDVRARLYERIGLGLEAYLDWLGGYETGSDETAKTLNQPEMLL